jgi:mRNA interferase MazF
MGRKGVDVVGEQFDVYLVRLDPEFGAEIKKTRPCVIVSPTEMNQSLLTVVVAPLTTTQSRFVFRVAIDHLRSVDKRRLIKRLGRLDDATQVLQSAAMVEMFRR